MTIKLKRRDFVQVAIVLIYVVIWIQIYNSINEISTTSLRTASFVPPLQKFPWLFQPWTGVIYFFGVFLSLILPLFWNWSRRSFTLVMGANAISSGIAFITYLLWPVRMIRPDFQGPGPGLVLMRLCAAWDGPSNCFPSFHAILAVLCALLITQHNIPKLLKAFCWTLAIAICGSTITVGQHYFMDVPAGILTAIFGFYAARWLLSRTPGKFEHL